MTRIDRSLDLSNTGIIDAPRNIDQLRALSADELKQLMEDFPYVPLYKVLLVKMLREGGHREMGEFLKQAALQAPDRPRLYRFLHFNETLATANVFKKAKQDIEEIKAVTGAEITEEAPEIVTIQDRATEAGMPVKGESVPEALNEVHSTPVIQSVSTEVMAEERPFVDSGREGPAEVAAEIVLPLPARPQTPDRKRVKSMLGDENSGNDAAAGANQKLAGITPVPQDLHPGEKHTFLEWLALLEGQSAGSLAPAEEDEVSILETQIDELSFAQVYEADIHREIADMEEEDTEPVLDAEVSASVKDLADKSLSMNAGLVTETLARLMLMQGKKKESIALYEQLRLKYPEKSGYFAAQIDAIKSK